MSADTDAQAILDRLRYGVCAYCYAANAPCTTSVDGELRPMCRECCPTCTGHRAGDQRD